MTGHGGNIYRAAEETGLPESRIIDFSASINPLGVPKSVVSAIAKSSRYLFNYPDPDAGELKQRLSKYHRISKASILCGNGSTELIYLVARALKPGKVLIPQPTFSEYERACKTASCKLKVSSYKLKQENDFEINPDEFISSLVASHSSLPFDMAFLCNPNNPTGGLVKKREVLKIADAAEKLKCHLVVDEAFIDFCPKDSVVNEVCNNPYLIVLRSMTKFYALSGLRLGYGVFPLRLVEMLNRHKEPWTVNTLAQKAGIAALNDKAYEKKTLALIRKEKKFLENIFKKMGIKFFHSDANFYLLKISNAVEICKKLKKKGLLVRDCSNFRGLGRGYIRVAVKTRKDNEALIRALNLIKEGG